MQSPLLEIDLDQLDEVDDFGGEMSPPQFIRHGGVPFTGIAVERTRAWTMYWEYRDGRVHGTTRTLDKEGRVCGEKHYHQGVAVGESRSWAPDGTLRTRRRFGEDGKVILDEHYDTTGRLRTQRTPDTERSWYADGGLRSERSDGYRWAFTQDGRRAFGEGVQTREQARVYDHFFFDDAVLADALTELLGEFEFQRGACLWLIRRLDQGDARIIDDLRALLSHPELEVRAYVLRTIGARGLRELREDVRTLVDDNRVPPTRLGEYPAQGSRGHSVPIGQLARDVLGKLGEL